MLLPLLDMNVNRILLQQTLDLCSKPLEFSHKKAYSPSTFIFQLQSICTLCIVYTIHIYTSCLWNYSSIPNKHAYYFLNFFPACMVLSPCAKMTHEVREIVGQKFVCFCILLGILKLKKYLKIFSTDTT